MKYLVPILIIITVVSLSAAVWGHYNPKVIVQESFTEVMVPVEVEVIRTVDIPVEKIIVKEKEKIVEVYILPPDVAEDPDKQITAAGEIPAYDGKTTVLSVFDIGTGRTELIQKREPRPFFSFERDKELGARYLLGTGGNRLDLFGRWTLGRASALYGSLYGEVNVYGLKVPELYGGIEGALRF